jgi:DnaJ family protein C protein 28
MSAQSSDPADRPTPGTSGAPNSPAATSTGQPTPATSPGPAPKRRRQWSDVVEEILNEAQARGDFDNLPGKGQPQRFDDDFYAGDKALAYRLLKNNDVAPPEIERGREIDAELARAQDLLETLRRRRAALVGGRATVPAAERRMYNLVRDKTEAQYRELLRAIHSKVLSLNILAPAPLQRPLVPVEARMRAFADEFPRLEE